MKVSKRVLWSKSSKDNLCDVGLYAFSLTTAKLI